MVVQRCKRAVVRSASTRYSTVSCTDLSQKKIQAADTLPEVMGEIGEESRMKEEAYSW